MTLSNITCNNNKMTNGLQKFIQDNGWSILISFIVIAMAWATLNAKVNANAEEIDSLTILVERVIRLEEHDENVAEDIIEIKEDLKDIKKSLSVHTN